MSFQTHKRLLQRCGDCLLITLHKRLRAQIVAKIFELYIHKNVIEVKREMFWKSLYDYHWVYIIEGL